MNPYDGIVVGETVTLGTYEFTADRIKAFARQWDTQLFHTDEEAARKTAFGGLCASGWHTCAILMRLQVDYLTARVKAGTAPRLGPSPGFEDLKWLRPVYAGDHISYAGTVTEKRLSKSRPGMAIMTIAVTATNQDDKPVMTMTGHVFALVG
jgi:acyl dehydratase